MQSAYADIPDYDCEQPGLDAQDLDGMVLTPGSCAASPAPQAPPARDTDVEHTYVARVWLWDYQWKKLRLFVDDNAGHNSPDDLSVRSAFSLEARKGEREYQEHSRFQVDLDYLARRWLRQRQRAVEALFGGRAAGEVRKLFS